MRTIGVIPARLGSSRFPGKPLAQICGLPMIQHVYRRTSLCPALDEVYVATCDQEIAEATQRFGGKAILTSPLHDRASDRIAEVAQRFDSEIVVMVQGDEPLIVPEMIQQALQPLIEDPSVLCTNLAAPIHSTEEFEDRNTIKVVMAQNGDALYFSREPIPTRQQLSFANLAVFKQVCVIPFRRDFLFKYASLPPTPLEQAESIDMLRALEHGYPIRLVRCDHVTQAVDTPADLARVEKVMVNDALFARYRSSL
ncbi:MAG TPA: 3-deoxy-manno-octulosonate cytidylyltransferase [Pyrinomonadaceae bacterium]|jgi:3-deoxy-manno-octulosonate cytidylyltransferase (CMP-KDO synthetase)|nr:3-deoxy-manno-octulosonate cytidylyltransferase [Pyrinomonadaceae bacterium]